jgi:hypothetical protein
LKIDFSLSFLVPSTAGQVVKRAAEQGVGMLYLLAVRVDAFAALARLADTSKSSKMEFNLISANQPIKTAFKSARTMVKACHQLEKCLGWRGGQAQLIDVERTHQ